MKRLVIIALSLFVLSSPAVAGLISVSFAPLPLTSNVDLTTIGAADWAHWGLQTPDSINRKAGVEPLLDEMYPIGDYPIYQLDTAPKFSWSDGDPDETVTNTMTGLYVFGPGNGFQVAAAADTTPRTLKIFVGAYAAEAGIEALLTDASADSVITTNLSGPSSTTSGVYTVTYASDAPGELLVVNFVSTRLYNVAFGNVFLQAAAVATDNRPPNIALLTPTNNTFIPQPSAMPLTVSTSDDGLVTQMDYLTNGVLLATATTPPFSYLWNNPPPGVYNVTAVATDNAGARRTSRSAFVSVLRGGGELKGSVTQPQPSANNLTLEGTQDWIHWAYLSSNAVTRKLSGASSISAVSSYFNDPPTRYADHPYGFSWSDGTPTASVSGTRTGLLLNHRYHGFEFTAPADPRTRRLRVFAGCYGSRMRFEAFLSDFSAAPFVSTNMEGVYDTRTGIFTFDYASASPGQTLRVRFWNEKLHDLNYGNVSLQAATLALLSPALQLVPAQAGATMFTFKPDTGRSYVIEYSSALPGTTWLPLTNVTGNGSPATINDVISGPARFYRARMTSP